MHLVKYHFALSASSVKRDEWQNSFLRFHSVFKCSAINNTALFWSFEDFEVGDVGKNRSVKGQHVTPGERQINDRNAGF